MSADRALGELGEEQRYVWSFYLNLLGKHLQLLAKEILVIQGTTKDFTLGDN